MRPLLASILDDEDVAIGAVEDELLSRELTGKLNQPIYHNLLGNLAAQAIVEVRIYSSKKIIDVRLTYDGYRDTILELWDVDLRYEIFMEYLNQGYTINLYGRRNRDLRLGRAVRTNVDHLIGLYLDEYGFDNNYISQLTNFNKIISKSAFIIRQYDGQEIDKRNLNYILKSSSKKVNFKNLLNCNTLIVPDTFGTSADYKILNLNCKRLFVEGSIVVNNRRLTLDKCNIDNLVYSNSSKSFSTYDWNIIKFERNNIKHLLIDIAYEFNLQHVFASNFKELKHLTQSEFESYDDILHKYSSLHRMNNWMRDKAKHHQLRFSDFEAISPNISLKLGSQIYCLINVKNGLTGLEYPKWEK